MKKITAKDVAKAIDHSLLQPTMTKQDIIDGCAVAKKYGAASVCVKPSFVEDARGALEGSGVPLCTVIGFPHGSNLTEVKVYESELAIKQGCTELDMVLDIGRLLGGEYDYVESDIRAVCNVAHKSGAIVKVILENAYLDGALIEKACGISEAAGADFVKTSTGYAATGATLGDLRIMRSAVSERVRLKAAGGVRSLDSALRALAAGCDRVGCTATAAVMEEALKREAEGALAIPDDVGDVL